MRAILSKRFCFQGCIIIFYCGVFDRIYYAALKTFKIYDLTTVASIDDEDEMDYSSESSDGEADW